MLNLQLRILILSGGGGGGGGGSPSSPLDETVTARQAGGDIPVIYGSRPGKVDLTGA